MLVRMHMASCGSACCTWRSCVELRLRLSIVGKIAYGALMRGDKVLHELSEIISFATAARASNPLGIVTACTTESNK